MIRYKVLDTMFVVPANTLIELSPADAKLHEARLVPHGDDLLAVEPLFLKPGTEFGMNGSLPRAITNMLEVVGGEEAPITKLKRTSKKAEE